MCRLHREDCSVPSSQFRRVAWHVALEAGHEIQWNGKYHGPHLLEVHAG